jgi:hypothetical protein
MLGSTLVLDPHDLRRSAAVGVAAAIVLPIVPGHPGIECPLRRLTGVPCPLCGMTTSAEATVRLHLGRALAANPGGLAAVIVALCLLVLRPARIHVPAVAPMLALPALWLFELHRFSLI